MSFKILLDEEVNDVAGDDIQCDETYVNTLVLEVEGTFGNLALDIKGRYRDGGTAYQLPSTKASDRTQVTQISEAGVYLVDGTGLQEVFPEVASISGGNVTVRARRRVG